jgi:hypothetical protein
VPPPAVTAVIADASPTAPAPAATQPAAAGAHYAFTPVTASHFTNMGCRVGVQPQPVTIAADAITLAGTLQKWYPLTLGVAGPSAREEDETPNPFLDYRLQVHFIGPSGQHVNVPGFYAGDGQGSGAGSIWQARFTPDEVGTWQYCVSFRAGPAVAVDLDIVAGEPLAPDGASGEFQVTAAGDDAPGFFKWGRLEYVGGHYLKFRDGPYWLKGGANSPENFLGYAGFDNTYDQGGILTDFLHAYGPHVADWREGDPNFASADREYDARGLIGALNYLSDQHVNSIFFLPMNLGGDGQDSYPFLSPDGTLSANTHYDISKLQQWATVFTHAQEQGIALHMALNETEQANRTWLDGGALGVERKLFYREMVARFGHLPALKWNLSEESVFTREEVVAFADYLQAVDWAGHPIALHNPASWMFPYEQMLGDDRLLAMSVQYEGERAGALVEEWRRLSAKSGQPWVVDMDENNPAGVGLGPDNAGWLRKTILYDVYFSGGNVEWYVGYYDLPVGGDVNLENFRTREAMWQTMWYARRFMQDYLPFWDMVPADELLTGESDAFGGGEVFAYQDEIYAVYLPAATPSGILRLTEGRAYWLHWYDPRTGEFAGDALGLTTSAEGLPLGAPPYNPDGDWVVLVTATPEVPAVELPEGYP